MATATGSALAAMSPSVAARPSSGHLSTYASIAELDVKQAGQLRHIHNIAQQETSDFTNMLGPDPDNIGDFAGYRWQIMHMSDAMTLAYQNYLPNAPGAFKADYIRLIDKMLRQESWNYWREMSRFSKGQPPVGVVAGDGWWDPVVKENIFYSGVLARTVAQFAYFFADDRYDKVGSLAFNRPQYAKGADRVEYSLQTLLDTIYWQLVENGFLGVACQPDMVFNSCSQLPIHAFGYEDRRQGTHRASEVIASHEAAWRKFGGYIDGKPMPTVRQMKAERTIDIPWGLGYYIFNPWNPTYFRSTYPMVRHSVMRKSPDRVDLYAMDQYGETQDSYFAGTPQPLVRKINKGGEAIAGPYGTVAMLLAEAGDPERDTLIEQADAHMRPVWKDGGYFYPRHDADWDEQGNVVGVAPTTTFALAVARLNGGDGLRGLFANHGTTAGVAEPLVASSSGAVDITRARFDAREERLLITMRPPHGAVTAKAEIGFVGMDRPSRGWTMSLAGRRIASCDSAGTVKSEGDVVRRLNNEILFSQELKHRADVVVQWA